MPRFASKGAGTFPAWGASAGPRSVKGSRFLTHICRLRDLGQGLERFWATLARSGSRESSGLCSGSLPPDFPSDPKRLEEALKALPPALHCFEFRHPSWLTPEIRDLLASRGAGLVIAHDARRNLPRVRPAAGIAYLRFHYGERGRRGNYSAAELERWARRIAAWRARSEVYAYFNNDWSAYAPRDALALRKHLSHPGAS